MAEAASARHGWPLIVIEDAADDPPLEQPDGFLAALRVGLGDPAAPAQGGDRAPWDRDG